MQVPKLTTLVIFGACLVLVWAWLVVADPEQLPVVAAAALHAVVPVSGDDCCLIPANRGLRVRP